MNLSRHMTSDGALKVLEGKDVERRGKELVKEIKIQKIESAGKENDIKNLPKNQENRENAQRNPKKQRSEKKPSNAFSKRAEIEKMD